MSDVHLLAPEDPRWHAFAVAHATSPTQLPSWLETITRAYRLRARVFALLDADGAMLAALPAIGSRLPWKAGWTALPFTDTLAPVTLDERHGDRLLEALAQSTQTQPVLIRTHSMLPGWFCRRVGTVQIVDLSDGADGVLRGAKRKTRQNIRLAEKAGLSAQPIDSRREFLGASLRLIARSRRRLGAPTQPRRYWSQVWRLHERGEALTIGIYHSGELVANGVFLIGHSHAVFKYSASDVRTRDLRSNYLTVACALEHLAARGVRSLDFGITDVHNRSLREYKTRWGGEETSAYFSATSPAMLPDTIEPGRLLTGTIQHTPVLVGRAIGSLAYPFAA